MNNNELGVISANIPGQAAFNPNLTATEKFLFWMIYSLAASGNSVYGTNRYFAQKLNVTEKTISRSIKSLAKYHYIVVKGSSKRRKIEIDQGFFTLHLQNIAEFNKPYQRDPSGTSMSPPSGTSMSRRTSNNNKALTLSKDNCVQGVGRPVKTTASVELIINHWNNIANKVLRKCRKDPGTKTYKLIVTQLKKRLKEHSKKDIIQAITDWYEIIIDPYSKLHYDDAFVADRLDNFLKPYAKQVEEATRSKYFPNTFISCFDEAIKGKEYLQGAYKSVPEIKSQVLVDEFTKLWKKYLYDWNRSGAKHLTHDHKRMIITASNRVFVLWNAVKDNLIVTEKNPFYKPKIKPEHFLTLLFKMIENKQSFELHYFIKDGFIKDEFKSWLLANDHLGVPRKQRRRLSYKQG